MISILTALALVASSLSFAGQILYSQITQNTAFVAGSQVISGNTFYLPDSSTTTANSEYVGIQQTVKHTAAGYDFITNGSQSGVVLKDNGTVTLATRIVTCTATGGNVKVGAGAAAGAKYDTCLMPPLLTTTGAITRIDLMVSSSEVAAGIDCGFVKGAVSGTGTSFQNIGNVATGTGLTFTFGSGSLQWNTADYIKCGTLTTLGPSGTSGKGFAAKLRVQYFDTTAE